MGYQKDWGGRGGTHQNTKKKNLLPQNSSFEVYFRGKTQPNNSKGTTSFRNCIQKPSIVQLTKTFRLRSAPAFPHFCVTLTL